jgi:mRNA interferase YafQ
MLELYIEGRCRKDIKRAKKRGKNLDKLWSIVDKLRKFEPLEMRHRPHRLSGNWYGAWECHIEPDWLLIYHITDKSIILVRTGTHSDLFE